MEPGQFSASHLHIPEVDYALCGSKNLLNNTYSGFGSISFTWLTILPRLQMLAQGTRAALYVQKGRTLISSMNWIWFMPVVKLCPDLFLTSTALFFTWCVMTLQAKSENSSAGD